MLGFDRDTNQEILNNYVLSCDFLVHLAGVNRPINEDEFDLINFDSGFHSFIRTCVNNLLCCFGYGFRYAKTKIFFIFYVFISSI